LTAISLHVRDVRSIPVGFGFAGLGVLREIDLLPHREGTSRNGWQPTADALLTMEVQERHARTRAITRGTVLPANRVKRVVKNASRGVARVVSDVSVLCPCAVVGFDNYPSLPMDMGVRRWALTSDSTLRYRERAEVETPLVEHG
jgi:hypothetical protein